MLILCGRRQTRKNEKMKGRANSSLLRLSPRPRFLSVSSCLDEGRERVRTPSFLRCCMRFDWNCHFCSVPLAPRTPISHGAKKNPSSLQKMRSLHKTSQMRPPPAFPAPGMIILLFVHLWVHFTSTTTKNKEQQQVCRILCMNSICERTKQQQQQHIKNITQ